MKQLNFITIVILAIFVSLGCTLTDKNKMPLTTSSKKALKYYNKACMLSENMRNEESREYYEKAIAEDPDFAMAHLRLALAQEIPVEFFANFEKAMEHIDNVSDGERMWILGVEAGTNGQINQQRDYYEKMVNLYPDDERCRNTLGNFYFQQQLYDLAIEQYKAIIEIDPDFSPVYNMLGYSYRRLKNYSESKRTFEKYIELIPNDPNPYDSYAELLMKMGSFDESIKSYQKSIDIDPYFTASYVGIATNLNYKDEHIKARNKLHELFELAKNIRQQREALYAMAVSYVDEQNLEMSLKMLHKEYSISEKADDTISMNKDLLITALVLLEMGEYDKAELYFSKGNELIKQSSYYELMKENIGRLNLSIQSLVAYYRGDYQTAQTKADEFLKLANEVASVFQIMTAHELKGMIAMAEKDYQKALSELRQANQENPYILYRIGLAYEALGEDEIALGFFQKAADYRSLNDLSYAFIRKKAMAKVK